MIKYAEKTCVQFQEKADQLLNQFQELISIVPYKGDKSEDCQRINLQKALNSLDAAVNGTSYKDFIKD